jgi:hypothetical protein
LIELFSPTALGSARGKFASAYTAGKLPHLLYVDDYQIRTIITQFSNPDGFYRIPSFQEGKSFDEYGKFTSGENAKIIEAVRTKWMRNLTGLLIPLHSWGDHDWYLRKNIVKDFIRIDPSCKLLDWSVQTPKKRQWVCSSLTDQTEFVESLSPSWEVIRQFKSTSQKGQGKDWGKIPEREVVSTLYSPSTGTLIPDGGRSNDGTGWWRPRYQFALQSQCLVYTVGKERKSLVDYFESNGGVGNLFDFKLDQIESLNDKDLSELAYAQWCAYLSQRMENKELLSTLDEAITSKRNEALTP